MDIEREAAGIVPPSRVAIATGSWTSSRR